MHQEIKIKLGYFQVWGSQSYTNGIMTLTGSEATDKALAGFLAGAISTATLHPLDLIKTRLQCTQN
jgi:hypothetical protein